MSARRKNHDDHEGQERWLVSYADFITLLFAFFVVLYATSTQNVDKEKKFEDSIREKLKLVGVGGGSGQSVSVTKGQMGDVIEPIDLFAKRGITNEELEEHVQQLIDKNMTEAERQAAISNVRHDKMGVRISLAASTFFPSGSPKIRLPALKSLDKLAAILKQANRAILIEGHTDDQPVVGGQFDSNWELAALRATSVVRYLIKVHKMDAKRMAAISYSDQRPLGPNTNEANRTKNRRIEVLIVNNGEIDF